MARQYEDDPEERPAALQPTSDEIIAAEQIARASSADEIRRYTAAATGSEGRDGLRRLVAEHARHWDVELLTFAIEGYTYACAVARSPHIGPSEVEYLALRCVTGLVATTGFTTGMVNRLRRDVLRALIATHGLSATSPAGVALYEQARALDPTCEAVVPAPLVAYEMLREFHDLPDEWQIALRHVHGRTVEHARHRTTDVLSGGDR